MEKNFKCRASGASQIMTNARSKNETLGATAKTHCQDWLKEQLYGVRKEFYSKYTDKGNSVELAAIKFYNQNAEKNEQFFEDDFFTGTPDVILPDLIADIKSSWSPSTFPLFDAEPEPAYVLQGQVYMHLTGVKKFELVYCLMDTPMYLIEREAFAYCDKYCIDMQTFIDKMTYNHIPANLRIKKIAFDYDASVIEAVKERVIECRNYINSLSW